ncbi:hypothetical protein OIX85_003877 [Vibrio parahaemolyticus]|uniref:hypothetical protein n=1 Tax=Vibrio alginolyticus TaxID=663 RepID=UPI0035C69878|nr:hypothetical protein [Vibrio parahaemolyticus]
MIFSLGGFVFSSAEQTALTSLSTTKKGEYTEQKLVDGAMSVKTGRPLTTKTLDATWLGTKADDNIKDLDVLLEGHHILSDKDGRHLGEWTLDSITDRGSDSFAGVFQCHKVTLQLREFRLPKAS